MSDICQLWEVQDPLNNHMVMAMIHYDEFVHGVSIEMEKGFRKTLGWHLGDHQKIVFHETSQPVGFYGVKDYRGRIQGLGMFRALCKRNASGDVVNHHSDVVELIEFDDVELEIVEPVKPVI